MYHIYIVCFTIIVNFLVICFEDQHPMKIRMIKISKIKSHLNYIRFDSWYNYIYWENVSVLYNFNWGWMLIM